MDKGFGDDETGPRALAWVRSRPGLIVGAALVGLVVWAALARLRFLSSSPYPFGIDGYFYPIEIRALLEEGRLYYPSLPLVPWLLTLCALPTDPIVGAKLGAAVGTALLALPVYALGRRLSGERGPALLGAALVATSPAAAYLATEFVKEGVGVTLAAACVLAVARAAERPSRWRVALVVLAVVACALAHKTAMGLAFWLGFPILAGLAGQGRTFWSPRARSGGGPGLVLALVLAGAALTAFLWWRDPVATRGVFAAKPDFTLPVLVPGGGARAIRHGGELVFALVVAVAYLVVCLLDRRRAPGERRVPSLAVGFLTLTFALSIPWLDVHDDQGLAYRLRLVAFLPLGVLGAALFSRLAAWLGSATTTRGLAAAGAALALVLWRPSSPTEGVIRTHPELVAAVRGLEAGRVPTGVTVVTPERHVMYMVTWYARVPARLRVPPTADVTRFRRLLPGAWIGPALRDALDALEKAAPAAGVPAAVELHPKKHHGLVLLEESTWKWLLGRLPEPTRGNYDRWPTR